MTSATEVQAIGDRMLAPLRAEGKRKKGQPEPEPDMMALAELLVATAVNIARLADAAEKLSNSPRLS